MSQIRIALLLLVLYVNCYSRTLNPFANQAIEVGQQVSFFKENGWNYASHAKKDSVKDWIDTSLEKIYCFEKKQAQKGSDYKSVLEYNKKGIDTSAMLLRKLNIARAYFDVGLFNEGFPYLEFINKYHKKYGDKNTIVALNMLNGMYYGFKGEHKKANSSFLNSIKSGKNKTDTKSKSRSVQYASRVF